MREIKEVGILSWKKESIVEGLLSFKDLKGEGGKNFLSIHYVPGITRCFVFMLLSVLSVPHRKERINFLLILNGTSLRCMLG